MAWGSRKTQAPGAQQRGGFKVLWFNLGRHQVTSLLQDGASMRTDASTLSLLLCHLRPYDGLTHAEALDPCCLSYAHDSPQEVTMTQQRHGLICRMRPEGQLTHVVANTCAGLKYHHHMHCMFFDSWGLLVCRYISLKRMSTKTQRGTSQWWYLDADAHQETPCSSQRGSGRDKI